MQQLTPVILLVVLLIVFWFVVLRPARNQQRTQAALQSSLEVGDEVVLSAGVFGTIRRIEESRVHLEIAPGTVVQVARQVVVRRVDDTGTVDGVDAPGTAAPVSAEDSAQAPAKKAPAERTPAKKTTATKAPAKKTPAKKTAAKKTTPSDGRSAVPGPADDGDSEAVTLDKPTDEAQDADRG